MRTIKALALAVPAAALIWATEARAAEHDWRMPTEWGGGPLMELGAKAFAERIKFMTDGRIEVQVLPAGTVAKGLESRTAVANGVVEAMVRCTRRPHLTRTAVVIGS